MALFQKKRVKRKIEKIRGNFVNFKIIPNGHTTPNRSRFHVDITSIRPKPYFDEFPRYFQVLFRRNCAVRKLHVVFTYTFFDVILMVEKFTLVARALSTIFRRAEIRRRFWLSCKLIKTFERVFL